MDELQKTVVQPKKDALDKLQATIQANTDKLRKNSLTMSLDAQKKLQADIDADTKTFNRSREDADSDVQEQEGKIMQELGTKMMTILQKYATDNGFAVILDVSNQQTPVLWAASEVNITNDIVKLYDEKYPLSAVTAPAAPAAACDGLAPEAGYIFTPESAGDKSFVGLAGAVGDFADVRCVAGSAAASKVQMRAHDIAGEASPLGKGTG